MLLAATSIPSLLSAASKNSAMSTSCGWVGLYLLSLVSSVSTRPIFAADVPCVFYWASGLSRLCVRMPRPILFLSLMSCFSFCVAIQSCNPSESISPAPEVPAARSPQLFRLAILPCLLSACGKACSALARPASSLFLCLISSSSTPLDSSTLADSGGHLTFLPRFFSHPVVAV